MSLTEQHRQTRRERTHSATRISILDAARRVAEREGARNLSLRATASEAGFTPAALYGYFRNKDDLLLALAADDLSGLARAMREAAQAEESGKLGAASAVALDLLEKTETIAAASTALPFSAGGSDAERLFNGRLIAALTALSEVIGEDASSREAQADVVLIAAALSGLALLSRSGRLAALGFSNDELLRRLDRKFTQAPK
ncbi:MAG TPA: helix-turn-helix domain-containing protein [Rhizomicrobium sp.]